MIPNEQIIMEVKTNRTPGNGLSTKILFLTLLFVMFQFPAFSQTKKMNDKHLERLKGELTDSARIATHLHLARRYSNTDSTEMMNHLKMAGELADQIEDEVAKVDIIFVMSRFYLLRNMTREALRECELALDYSKRISYKKGEALAYARAASAYLEGGDLDTVEFLFNKAIEGQTLIDDKPGLVFSHLNLGGYHLIKGNYEIARAYYNKTLDLKEAMGKSRNYPSILMKIGNTFSEQGLYLQALEYYFQSAEIFEKVNNKRYLASTLNDIGNVFVSQNEYREALKYYEKSLKVREELEYTNGIAESLNSIGFVFIQLAEYDRAIEYLNKSFAIYMEMDDPYGIAACYNNLGEVYNKLGKVQKALEMQNQSLKLHQEIGEQVKIAATNLTIAELYLKQNDITSASSHTANGLAIAEEVKSFEELKKAYELLSNLESKRGNYKNAFDAHLKYKQYADSLINQENTKAITKMEAKYEFQQEKDSIAFAQEKIQLDYEQEIEQKKTINQAAIGAAALVFIILILLYRSYLIKQRKNLELHHKNEMIESKNNELVSKNEEIMTLRETEKKMSEESLALKERELTNITMLSHEKNELLQQIGNQIGKIGDKVDEKIIPDLKEIKQTIKSNISNESWNAFTYHFEQVHPEFFNKLKESYDELNQNDLRLCAYIKVGLNNKVIAQMNNITLAGVKKNINRLKKKLELEADDSLRDFMMKFI